MDSHSPQSHLIGIIDPIQQNYQHNSEMNFVQISNQMENSKNSSPRRTNPATNDSNPNGEHNFGQSIFISIITFTVSILHSVKKTLPKIFFVYTPSIYLYKTIVYLTIPLIVWIIMGLLLMGDGNGLLPSGPLFGLIVIEFCGIGLGMVFSIFKLPPLLGMLTIGILIKNVPLVDFGKALTPNISSPLRQIALVIILIRAGLGLDPNALMKLKGVVIRLAFTPCLVEATTIGFVSHFILGFPWVWGFLLGFVMAAVSPAVIVPCLLNLRDKGYGVKKGIPTIVIAASSVDDILAISLFGIFLGFGLSSGEDSLFQTIIQGPLEFVLGIVFGTVYGIVIAILISKADQNNKNATIFRAFFIFSGGILSVFGFQYLKYPGAGALGCLTLTFVASIIWRKRGILSDGDNLNWTFSLLWFIFQPLLFGLIGCEIDLENLDANIIGLGILCLSIGLIFRIATTFLVVSKAGFNLKEKIFIAISWLPKATVQAAIGPIALDSARLAGAGKDIETIGLKILAIAVLSILITAPIGATLILLTGPRLLSNERSMEEDVESNKRNKLINDLNTIENHSSEREEASQENNKIENKTNEQDN